MMTGTRNLERLTVQSGGFAAVIAPASGGALLSLSYRGRHILRPAPSPVPADPRDVALYICAPYFGRLPGGLRFGGRHFPIDATVPAADPVNALHGDAWLRPWRVIDVEPGQATLSFTFEPEPRDGSYPFPYTVTQRWRLSPDGAVVSVRLRNDHVEAAPLGLALHPFLVRDPDTTVAFDADQLWRFDPVRGGGVASALPQDDGYGRARRLPAETIDQAYLGFGGAVVAVTGGRAVRLRSDATILHVFAPAGETFFCLEPATHRPCAFGDEQAAAPGESISLALKITV